MPKVQIKPSDQALNNYYKNLKALRETQNIQHEGGTRRAFGTLLNEIAANLKWTLVEELSLKSSHSNRLIRIDGALRDQLRLARAYWEAKDSQDDLEVEIEKKKERGYPLKNIIFEDTERAVLYQDDHEAFRAEIQNKNEFARLLTLFFNYERELFDNFEQAIDAYKEKIPHIAATLKTKIKEAHQDNRKFKNQFAEFMSLCRTSLNPNISQQAVDEMLIQHLMTERIIRHVFQVERFTRDNVVAAEIEKVIDALTSQHFNRQEFLGALAPFYKAVESVADRQADFQAKQDFINTVYERFFQGYSVKVADTHGIVYTPQPIVDFMCAAVEEALETEFDRKLGDEGVILIDPATGTGSFVVNLLRRAFESNLSGFDDFYKRRLFANEVMLMPYYIASLNIEHEYYQLTGKVESFPGLCFVDTLDLTEGRQLPSAMISEKNSERIDEQRKAKINVIIGNPPYNARQVNENDNNKNRQYDVIDQRIRETYASDSKATLKNQLYDAYVKFFRWATDRLEGRDGIVCYVSNNSFVDARAFDGMRKHLLQDFNLIYHLDLGGNLRKGGAGNVFDIRVGVGITVAIRKQAYQGNRLHYSMVDSDLSKKAKLNWLREQASEAEEHKILELLKEELKPNKKHDWIISNTEDEFETYLPIGSPAAKRVKSSEAPKVIFKTYSLGVSTKRDYYVYDYEYDPLVERMRQFIENYNAEVDRYRRSNYEGSLDDFVNYDKIKWSSTLKANLKRENYAGYDPAKIRDGLYRPFTKMSLYYAKPLIDRPGQFKNYFPNERAEAENRVICVAAVGNNKPFHCLITDMIPDLHLTGDSQCFPFYTYNEDGSNRKENITDWALAQFRGHYDDPSISKWDIFYYVYALLHHPRYRERYALDLKRQLPRIPYAPDFRPFSQAGQALADLHLNYENSERYKLRQVPVRRPVSYAVSKMRPGPKRQSETGDYKVYDMLKYNDTLCLRGIPERAFAYRLGNRSALEWVVDQYRVKTDKRSGITHNPNRYSDDEQYIPKLIERVIWVSLRTVDIVERLETLPFGATSSTA